MSQKQPFNSGQAAGDIAAGAERARRYVPDLSGFRYMPGVFCPACRGNATRRFTVENGSLVPHHEVGCEKKCGFKGLIKGRVVPETEADGKTMKETPAQAFQKLLDRMHREKLAEVDLRTSSR